MARDKIILEFNYGANNGVLLTQRVSQEKNFALEWYAAFSSQIALRELHSYTV